RVFASFRTRRSGSREPAIGATDRGNSRSLGNARLSGRVGGASSRRRIDKNCGAAARRGSARGARYRVGCSDRRRCGGNAGGTRSEISARSGCAAAKRGTIAAPMMRFVSRLLRRQSPIIAEARPTDAAAIAALHAVSFRRGWGEDEVQRLLVERNVVTQHMTAGGKPIGFIMSRLAAGEAEILSVAIAPAWRGRGVSRQLLDLHLRRLAGLGVHAIYLEVGEHNAPACRLYRRAGFTEVGRRQGYYEDGATALVLRRDFG